jgi:hypothetical protein
VPTCGATAVLFVVVFFVFAAAAFLLGLGLAAAAFARISERNLPTWVKHRRDASW